MNHPINSMEQFHSPEVIKLINNDLPGYINGSLSELNECEKNKNQAIKSASTARKAAEEAVKKVQDAKQLSTGFFKNGKVIDSLKAITESEAIALDDISRAQIDQAKALKVFFENQKKQAGISKTLCLLGMGNQAVANSILKRLKEGLEGGALSNINEEIYQEFERIVMWWSQVEDINAKIRNYENRVAEIQIDYNNVVKELLDIKGDLKHEIDTRLHSIDKLQKTIIAYNNELQISISKDIHDIRTEYDATSEAIKFRFEEIRTVIEEVLLDHDKQLTFLQDDYTRYKSQFFNKIIFKTIVLILSISAFILSIISLIG